MDTALGIAVLVGIALLLTTSLVTGRAARSQRR